MNHPIVRSSRHQLIGRGAILCTYPLQAVDSSGVAIQIGNNHFFLRVIEHNGAGCAESQESSGPGIPTQSSSNPVRAAKHMRHLQHRRNHDARWSMAELLPRTSAPERNYSTQPRILRHSPAGPDFEGAGAELRSPAPQATPPGHAPVCWRGSLR